MSDKLLSCPFCGGEAKIGICDAEGNYPKDEEYENNPWSGLGYLLVHDETTQIKSCPIACFEGEPTGTQIYDTREEAVAAWNARRAPDIVHCAECKHQRKCGNKSICVNGLAGGSANVNAFIYGETIARVVTDSDFCSKGVRREIQG